MKQVELVNGDLRFPALMAGEGEPVILLHGFPDTYENWAVQINAIAEAGYTAIAPALRASTTASPPIRSEKWAFTCLLQGTFSAW